MAVELAVGYVSLVVDTRNVPGDLARAFARAGDQTVGVDVDASGVRRDLQQAFRRAGDQTVGVDVDASGVRGQLNREFSRAGDSAGQAGGQAAGGSIAEALAGMGGKGGAIGLALGAAFTLAGVSVGGLFVKALQQGMQREQALDLTQARLGVDEATMARIATAAGRSYVDAFGESVEANADTARRAVQSGLIDPTASTEEFEQVISQLSGISDLMGEEIPAVARAAGQAVKTGIAKDATEAFDLFAAAERNGLNVSEDFLDTVTEYSTQFRKLGLTGAEALGLMNQAVKAGARDSDIAADAIKEFSIRVVDGSESTSEAFTTLGFDADDLAGRFAAGGAVARTAVGELLAEIREIEDPAERNKIALALFGTQFEDLGGALDAFNVDTAVQSLGQLGGAAQSAADAMGNNAATSIESAKRSIQVSADEISVALANAFGPSLAKLADWVSTHQPEILGFMGAMVDGALGVADAFLSFASGVLHAFADVQGGLGDLIGPALRGLGTLETAIGGFLEHVPGMGDVAEAYKATGEATQAYGDLIDDAADKARALADGIDTRVRPALDGMRTSITDDIGEAQRASEVFRALGDTVTAIPSAHGITLSDNVPDVRANLEALGLTVTTLPDGQVEVTANTTEGQARLDAFVRNNSGKEIPVRISPEVAREKLGPLAGLYVPEGRAAGGVFHGRGGPTDDANLVRISNREHLAYITRAQATNPATIPFLDAINSGWVPPAELLHGMVPGFAEGGIAGNRALGYARSHAGEPYVYGGLDCSGYLSGIYGALTQTGSRFTTDSDFSAWGFVRGYDPFGFSIGTDGGSGVNGHMAGTLFGTNVESDGTNGVQFGGSADGAADFPNVWHLPRELWSPPETDDPSKATSPGSLGGSNFGGLGGGGLGTGGAGAGAAGGTAGRPVTVNGQSIPAGVTPVWVVNATGTTDITPTPAQSVAPATGAQSAQSLQQPMDLNARALDASNNFLNANIDQFLGDLGLRRSGGALQALVQAVYDAMARAAAEEVRRASRNGERSMMRYAGRP